MISKQIAGKLIEDKGKSIEILKKIATLKILVYM